MKRLSAVLSLGILLAALTVPAAQSSTGTDFALAGEARGLEIALGDEGATLGLAMSRVDSRPRALGVGAGQCTLLGEDPDPEELPCSAETMKVSRYPGEPGSEDLSCAQTLPDPLRDLIDLKLACGSSTAGLRGGLPTTRNHSRLGSLGVRLPVGQLVNLAPPEVERLVDDLTDALAPVLGAVPEEVNEAVGEVVELLRQVQNTQLVQARLGSSHSNIVPDGTKLTVDSDSAGARIGLIGIPDVTASGRALPATANPLENGLVIIEIGTAQATAAIDTLSATATADASPALVIVKVRDITKEEPSYVTVTVAPGETVTVLRGTPAESTITAAVSTTEVSRGSARSAADGVRMHLLKGVQGGVTVGLARATAAANAEPLPAPQAGAEREPLPVTGGTDRPGLAVLLIAFAAIALLCSRRLVRR